MMHTIAIKTAALVLLIGASAAQAESVTFPGFTMDFVDIGNAGNANDAGTISDPYGGVSYAYQMGVNEVSEAMIGAYNTANPGALITLDTRGADKPATSVNWNEAARFVNWLNTSTGHQAAYNVSGGVNTDITLWSSADAWQEGGENLFRHKDAHYFLPSEDEWYKAAYYDPDHGGAGVGGYWDYATGSDTPPAAAVSGLSGAVYSDSGQAVFPSGPADINAAGGLSPYGTMAQSGNVWEWGESGVTAPNDSAGESRVIRGGAWNNDSNGGRSHFSVQSSPTFETFSPGFRVAAVPEPSNVSLLVIQTEAREVVGEEGVDFGTVGRNGYRAGDFRIRNEGASDLLISAVEVVGVDVGNFSAVPSFFTIPNPFVLASGGETSMTIRFDAPEFAEEGARSAVLRITSPNVEVGVREIPLMGTILGFAQAQPTFRYRRLEDDVFTTLADGDTVDFGEGPLGEALYLDFEIENAIASDADFMLASNFGYSEENGIVRNDSGSSFQGFGMPGPDRDRIPPGSTFGFNLQFTPTARGQTVAEHVFNNSFESFTTNLTGTGLAGKLVVTFPDGFAYESGLGFVDFGVVAIGSEISRTFSLRNDGDADLFVTSLLLRETGLGSANGLNYLLGQTPDDPLAPGETMTLEIEYSPQSQTSLEGVEGELYGSDFGQPIYQFFLEGNSALALQVVDEAIAASGLTGEDALPEATPFDDGVPNLLKIAFNMNLAGADSSQLTAGGNAGLPTSSLDSSGPETVWKVEFVRRKGSGLIYTPMKSATLSGFEPMTGATTVSDIDGQWERVVVSEPCDPATTSMCFSHVAVTIPE